MIDIESQVFTTAATALRGRFEGLEMSSAPEYRPSRFPFVSLREGDNYVYRASQDSGSNENHANVMYEADIYSTKENGKKQEARAIQSALDEVMNAMGFTRTTMATMTDKEGTMVRISSRYTAVVSKNQVIYGR